MPTQRSASFVRVRRTLLAAWVGAVVLVPARVDAVENGGAGWVGVTLRVPFADRYSFHLLTEPRFFEQPERIRVLVLRPWFEVALPHGLGVGLGYDAVLTVFPVSRQEHRVWQQLSHRHRFPSVTTVARFRLEERFFNDVASVSVRGRLLLGVEVPIVREVAFVLNDELFVGFNQVNPVEPGGLSENRLNVGFAWGPREWVTASIGYQNQWLEVFDVMNHTLMLQFVFTTPTGAANRSL